MRAMRSPRVQFRAQAVLTAVSFVLIAVSLYFGIASFVKLADQSGTAARTAYQACLRTQQVGPGLADFLEVYGVDKINPRTGLPFFTPKFIRDYRQTIPAHCVKP